MAAGGEKQCQEHPDRKAKGSCDRCGRFVCAGCAVDVIEELLCPSCAATVYQFVTGLPPTAGVAKVATWLLYAYAVLSGGTQLWRILGGPPDVLSDLDIVNLLLLIATAVFYLLWLYRAVRLMKEVDQDLGASPGWAVGYWFIPFLNLFRPYQVVSRLAAATRSNLSPGLISGWWALWVGSIALGWVEKLLGQSSVLDLLSAAVWIAGAFLCATVVTGIERGLVTWRRAYAPPATAALI